MGSDGHVINLKVMSKMNVATLHAIKYKTFNVECYLQSGIGKGIERSCIGRLVCEMLGRPYADGMLFREIGVGNPSDSEC